jgi:hypothetical protein
MARVFIFSSLYKENFSGLFVVNTRVSLSLTLSYSFSLRGMHTHLCEQFHRPPSHLTPPRPHAHHPPCAHLASATTRCSIPRAAAAGISVQNCASTRQVPCAANARTRTSLSASRACSGDGGWMVVAVVVVVVVGDAKDGDSGVVTTDERGME